MKQASALVDIGRIRGEASLWADHLGARNLSPTTIKNYMGAVDVFSRFLERNDMPQAVDEISPRHVEAFIRHELERVSASSAATRYRSLQQFFRYLVRDGVIQADPMAGMVPPKMDEKQVPVIPRVDLAALIKTVEGTSFEQRRDAALIRVLLHTGCRVGELVAMRMVDIDLRERELVVDRGKSRRQRGLALNPKANKALNRYLPLRARHKDADEPWIWLGVRGRMTESGVAQMLRRRCKQAGIASIHPHQFRHSLAHEWLSRGGNEHELAQLMGWNSLQMVGRYAASSASERAKDAHRRLLPWEDI